MRAGLRNCCEWAGFGRCTQSRLTPRRSAPYWWRASCWQAKLLDIEFSIRGILRGFGLKMGEVRRSRFAARVRELVTGHAMLERLSEPMLRAQEALQIEYGRLHREMLAIIKPDAVRPRLSTWRTVRDRRPPI
jgi:hypothetical protein